MALALVLPTKPFTQHPPPRVRLIVLIAGVSRSDCDAHVLSGMGIFYFSMFLSLRKTAAV